MGLDYFEQAKIKAIDSDKEFEIPDAFFPR